LAKTTATTKLPVVLATEAFDLAGIHRLSRAGCRPTKRLEPLLENCSVVAGQRKSIISPMPSARTFFRGKGPEYSVKDISKSSKQPYWRMALDSFRSHQTQAKFVLDTLAQMDEAQIEKNGHVRRGVDGRIAFRPRQIADWRECGPEMYLRASRRARFRSPGRNSCPSLRGPDLSAELDGSVELLCRVFGVRMDSRICRIRNRRRSRFQAPGTLVIPLWIRNRTAKTQEDSPSRNAAWQMDGRKGTGKFSLGRDTVAAAPRGGESAKRWQKMEPRNWSAQEITVHADRTGKTSVTSDWRRTPQACPAAIDCSGFSARRLPSLPNAASGQHEKIVELAGPRSPSPPSITTHSPLSIPPCRSAKRR